MIERGDLVLLRIYSTGQKSSRFYTVKLCKNVNFFLASTVHAHLCLSLSSFLVIDDLAILMKLLKDINDWEILGLHLGIKKTSLDRIGKDKQDTKTRCCETIFYWLKHSRDDIAQEVTPTFSSLIAILKDLGHEETVESIECYLSSET